VTAQYDVAIVGYGPVGAFSALLLAEEGLRVAILERSTEPVVLPRAVGLDGESVRAFQRIGLGGPVAGILQAPREVDRVCFTDSSHTELFGVDLAKIGVNGWRDTAFFDQPELEALLREFVAEREEIDVFLGREVVAVDSSPDDVCVRAADGSEVRASYVIGCDGASSFVRAASGIEWQSLGYDQDWLVLDIVQKPGADLPLVTMQVCDPERLTTYVCVKDPNRRWEFQLLPGETREEMESDEKIHELLASWVEPEHYEIRRRAVYQFHAATAERWRQDRVFLAGDAAHQTPPFLGQGLNSGLRDAVNLGWKIPLVLSGVCGDALLDSYAAERDAHARDLVEWAVAVGQLMETMAAREAGRPDPHPEVDQSSGYGQGRVAPPLRGGVLLEAQSGGDHAVGSLLRQPIVRDAKGRQSLLDEHIGRGFAVLGRKPGDIEMGPDASALFERLGGRSVSLEGLEVTVGEADRVFESHPAVLLRPDRYVFGVVDDDHDLDSLVVDLARRLALRPSDPR